MSDNHIDLVRLRGLTHARLARRQVLKMAGLGASTAGLAACGVKGSVTPKSSASPISSAAAEDAVKKFWAGKTSTGHVNFANWPLYINDDHIELKEFTAATNITVTYTEPISDVAAFYAKIQPQLANGQSVGYDIMVITDGAEFTEIKDSNWFAPLDHSQLPNFTANAGAQYKNEFFDPGNVYSIPWASGFTGIGYNSKYVKTPPTSLQDLMDPQYKGKIGMMSDTQEIGNFAMLAVGVDPEKSTPADWAKAADWLKQQHDAGLVRKYYDQDYIDDLQNGNIWLSMAWSGDIFQANLGLSQSQQLGFVVPKEGGTIWTDNMTIPVTADNPVDALKLMDWFYKPEIAAQLTEYIAYISPVPAAQAIIASDASKATGSDKTDLQMTATAATVWPSAADLAKGHYYRMFVSPTEQDQYNAVFSPIVTS